MADTTGRKVWAFMGDGEMDEPESMGAISLAGREHLDNLVFVINCNLQRLDGPVRGNGKIIQELETNFRGAGWNVIKTIWGRRWDPLLAADSEGLLVKRMEEAVDGEYQVFKSRDGAYVREHFFGADPELARMVEDWSDAEIFSLNRGGHDPQKVYNAYAQAVAHTGQPTVILAKTIKGYGMGESGEGQNITHQAKKMNEKALFAFRDRFGLDLTDDEVRRRQLPQAAPTTRPRCSTCVSARAAGWLAAAAAHRGAAAAGPRAQRVQGPARRHRRSRDLHHDGVRPDLVHTWSVTSSSAHTSCRSSPTSRAPSAWRGCSASWGSSARSASSTRPRTPTS